MWRRVSPNLLLRIAVAFAFLYAAIDSFIDPSSWVTFFPPLLLTLIPGTLLLPAWSIVEIGIALWLVSGRHIFVPALIAAASLVAIVVFNLPLMQIVFRDLSLACVALALALQARRPASAE